MKKVALIYDFDKTLITTNMQEKSFVEAFEMSVKEFWTRANSFKECDSVLAGILAPVILAKEKGIKYNKKFLQKHGAKLDNFFDGVLGWFDRINEFGLQHGIEIEHYVVSSGYYEMIASSKIANKLKKIFACKYLYDKKGDVLWPSVVVNYTQKTQYLARIQKNLIDDIYDDKLINMKMKNKDIYIPYSRMIYFGDGDTDVPSMKMLGSNGGHSICVYTKESIDNAKRLLKDGRVDYSLLADYSENSEIDKKVKEILLSIK